MARPIKMIVNCMTGEVEHVEFNDQEYADFLERQEATE
jgi:hypothetical protein